MSFNPPQRGYKCPKCNHTDYKTGQIRVTGGFWSKIFDVESRRFTSVTCRNCTYTEFYQGSESALSSIFDLMTN